MPVVTLENTTLSNIELSFGDTIKPGDTDDYSHIPQNVLANSLDLIAHINSGDIICNNGTIDLSPIDAIAFLNGQLALEYTPFLFEHTLIKNDTWLGTANIIGDMAGYTMPLDGTIVMMGARGLDCNADIDLSLYIAGTEHPAVLSLTGLDNMMHQSKVTNLSIDFNADDLIQVRSRRVSGVESLDVSVTLFVKWRKS